MNLIKETLFGMLVGFITISLCLPLVLWIMSLAYSYEFGYFWKQFLTYSVYTSKYLSLACIPNLFWFYFFLNRERWAIARGVIFSVLVFVPYAIYVNF
ncbi:MAG: hypothetical protein RL432_780 [Bacteroidota bacterium]|jgi:hypothetical protein